MFMYLMAYLLGFYSSVIYKDYTIIQTEVGILFDKLVKKNKKDEEQRDEDRRVLERISESVDRLVSHQRLGFNVRRASP